MSIKVKCGSCGSGLKVKDSLAGKRVKCPKCKQPITIKAAPAPEMQPSPVAAAHNPLLDLLDEQNIQSASRGPTCDNCAAELMPGAVVCIECGFNHESGMQLQQEIYEDDSDEASTAQMTDAERIMAKAERDIEDVPVTSEDQDFGDGADAFLIAAVGLVVGVILIGIGLTVILTMEQVGQVIASSAISLIASGALGIAMALWVTIAAFRLKPGHGIACVLTGFLWCIVFGFMQGRTLLLPTVILLICLVIGSASGLYTYYNGWTPPTTP